MAHGGSREGAGRPVGSANKLSAEARKKALAGGITPLDYLLSLLRDVSQPQDVRMDAAKAAAPYTHAKLANVAIAGDPDNPVAHTHQVEVTFVEAKGKDK